ncbi:MAG: apolipoprotein N-acyltransferase [Rhizobium sp.]|nr:apolipoprotein N-acyltransferase [Rhizobium sp.]
MERLAAYVTLSSGWKRFLIALLAGAFAALMLPPFGIFLVGFISFPILVWLIDGASGDPDRGILRRLLPSFRIGWAFGLGYFVAGLWWIGNSMLVEADEFAWALPLAVLGLPAFLALYYGLATALARLLWTDGFVRIIALAGAFGLAEWLRGILFTGFPWNAVGQGLMPFPLMMQSLTLIGSHSMNVVAVLIFAAPALIATGRGAKAGVGLALLLFTAHIGFGYYQLQLAMPPKEKENQRVVRLVQPVIDQAAKLDDSERTSVFEQHLALTKAARADGGKRPDYVIWPETSIPFILTQNPDALVRIADALEDGQILIAGAVRTESDSTGQEPRYYNSVYVIDSQGQIIGAADKVHLVPFGEYLPFEDFWKQISVKAIAAMPGGYSAATQHHILVMPDGNKLLPLICYEIIFPDETGELASQADAIVNLTNDGWFGYTPGPWQHFFQARLRAVETGLPVIRNSNSGISAVINAKGEIISGLGFQSKGYIDASIPTKIVLLLDSRTRTTYFWLLECMAVLIAFFTRMSFVFKPN